MHRPLGALIALSLLVAGCSATTPTDLPEPEPATPSPSPSESPEPEPEPKPRRARWVVSVVDDQLLVYDVRRDEVANVARGRNLRAPRWVSKDEITFLQDSSDGVGTPTTMRSINVRTGELRDVFTVDTGIRAYGWSPDRSTVAYVTIVDGSYPQLQYRALIGTGGTRTVTTLARAGGRERTDHDQERVEWSRDGSRVLMVYTPADGEEGFEPGPAESQMQIRGSDGSLLYAAPHEEDPTMGFWAPGGARAYFRTSVARSWFRDGSVRGLPNAPAWFAPSLAPDGSRIAYDTGASNAGVRVRVYDPATGATSTLTGRNRARPVFATKRVVWVEAFRRCANICFGETEPTGKVFAVDVRSGEVRELALPGLGDVDVRYVRPKG